LGCGDKPDYFTAVATVLIVRSQNSLYKACPTAECNKKVGTFPVTVKPAVTHASIQFVQPMNFFGPEYVVAYVDNTAGE
jgi:hypothetical protein